MDKILNKISCLLQSQHLVLGNSLVCSSLLSRPWHLLPGEAAEHAANVRASALKQQLSREQSRSCSFTSTLLERF